MRNYFIVFLMTVTFSGAIHAQSVNIGVKGGLNVYNLSGQNDFSSKAGVHIGVLGHIHMAEHWAFQPELMYSSQGTRYADGDNRFNLDYLNVPLLVQYMFDNGFRLQAGPQVGFLLNANNSIAGNEINVKEDFKNIDLGVSVGGSYVHPPSGFGVDARYNIGLTTISENNTYKNNGFQLGLFYLFNHRN
ncbi:porin family protein [Anditalea andensis]|uniref:Outer membrane protein beta-barrel domain-containing protein n=1 Tax=Anditalea andensis TaxID=1048983 RepID=A0A074L4Y9_9BACT|nr:porin family protein [Anditalea andensis]KEO74913.1 hypothetical protein EL17_04335 [Anditalea andensis]